MRNLRYMAAVLFVSVLSLMGGPAWSAVMDTSGVLQDKPLSFYDEVHSYSLSSGYRQEYTALMTNVIPAESMEAVEFSTISFAGGGLDRLSGRQSPRTETAASASEPDLWILTFIGIILVGYQAFRRNRSLLNIRD